MTERRRQTLAPDATRTAPDKHDKSDRPDRAHPSYPPHPPQSPLLPHLPNTPNLPNAAHPAASLDRLEPPLSRSPDRTAEPSDTIDAADFRPLDDDVERELAFLRARQNRFLLERWKSGWSPRLPLPDDLHVDLSDWRDALDGDRVAGYCAAASALIRRLLLDSSGEEEAHGRIESLGERPTLEVFAYPDSLLAAEEKLGRGGAIRLGPEAFAQHISQRCAEPLIFGDLAWRFLAPSLSEAEEVLPRLEVRPTGDHAIEVRLRSESTATDNLRAP